MECCRRRTRAPEIMIGGNRGETAALAYSAPSRAPHSAHKVLGIASRAGLILSRRSLVALPGAVMRKSEPHAARPRGLPIHDLEEWQARNECPTSPTTYSQPIAPDKAEQWRQAVYA